MSAFLDFSINIKRQLLSCKSAFSRLYATFNLVFNKFSTLSTYLQVFHSFNSTNSANQKMFNIIQQIINISFNSVKHVNTPLDLHFHTFNAPTTTTIFLLLLFYLLLIENWGIYYDIYAHNSLFHLVRLATNLYTPLLISTIIFNIA